MAAIAAIPRADLVDELERQQALVNEQAGEVGRLEARLRLTDVEIDEITEEVRHGNAQRSNQLRRLSDQRAALTQAVAVDRRHLTIERAKLTQLMEARQRSEFDRLISEGEQLRDAFIAEYRQTCLRLGSFCAVLDRLGHLANALVFASESFGAADVRWRHRIEQLQSSLDPLKAWDAEPFLASGWDLRFAICPKKER